VRHAAAPGRRALRVQPQARYLSAPRCAARARVRSSGAKPAPGFAMCECKGGQKALEIRIADQELDSLYSAAPAPAPVPAPLLAPPAGIVAATTVAAAATVVAAPGGKREREGPPQGAWKSQSGCYECGGRGGRGGLLRCLGCDAQFHGKCVDLKARGQRTEICLCGNCWDAQWQR